MLRHRVIPLVLLDGYSVVKTIGFDVRRNLGNPITVFRVYNMRNVDELIMLDIDASKQNRSIDIPTIKQVSKECFMPLTVGGGLKTTQEITKVLQAGADKVALNTVIWDDPDFLKVAVSVFGSQCIVASLDIKKNETGEYALFSHAKRSVQWSLEKSLNFVVDSNVGEILINNVDLDGKMSGFDYELIEKVSSLVKTKPIIFAGGASGPRDCSQAIKNGATAVSAASIFHFTNITPQSCRLDMYNEGIHVRLST